MTVALWCVLAAALIPYAFTIAAKSSSRFDNRAPREYLAAVSGWRQRANWAQINGFEAFPPFAAAVLVAHVTEAPQAHADICAIIFVVARLAYGLMYIADWAGARSVVWAIGLLAVVALFVISA